mmetsp:Transcript_30814/g.77993  ORF Transcript_30814/g.77993 Transcript_30814/m.77993 type:complete len:224 (-) Transcript_30814:277-948(-)
MRWATVATRLPTRNRLRTGSVVRARRTWEGSAKLPRRGRRSARPRPRRPRRSLPPGLSLTSRSSPLRSHQSSESASASPKRPCPWWVSAWRLSWTGSPRPWCCGASRRARAGSTRTRRPPSTLSSRGTRGASAAAASASARPFCSRRCCCTPPRPTSSWRGTPRPKSTGPRSQLVRTTRCSCLCRPRSSSADWPCGSCAWPRRWAVRCCTRTASARCLERGWA